MDILVIQAQLPSEPGVDAHAAMSAAGRGDAQISLFCVNRGDSNRFALIQYFHDEIPADVPNPPPSTRLRGLKRDFYRETRDSGPSSKPTAALMISAYGASTDERDAPFQEEGWLRRRRYEAASIGDAKWTSIVIDEYQHPPASNSFSLPNALEILFYDIASWDGPYFG